MQPGREPPPTMIWNPKTKRWVKRDGNIGVRLILAKKVRDEKKEIKDRMNCNKIFDFGASAKRAKVDKDAVGILPKTTAAADEPILHSGATLAFETMCIESQMSQESIQSRGNESDSD